MTQDELNKILEDHLKWIKDEDGGRCAVLHDMDLSGMILSEAIMWGVDLTHANLSGAIIRNADLNHADLSYANLSGADLSGADLRYAKLCDANLNGSKLTEANLSYTIMNGASMGDSYLEGANLTRADLRYANLCDSDLHYANLRNTTLYGSNLEYVNLYGAILEGADLRHANLKEANLCNANMQDTILDKSEKVRVGEILKEKILGYKKTLEDKIITLEIPKGAIVFSINNGKCRTNKVKVVECEGIQHSRFDCRFKYMEGMEIEIENFDLIYNNECGAGIHFFKTKKEAEEYNYF